MAEQKPRGRQVPAICRECGLLFHSGFRLGGKAVMIGCMSKCPKCGAPADIPSGLYDAVQGIVHLLREGKFGVRELQAEADAIRSILARPNDQLGNELAAIQARGGPAFRLVAPAAEAPTPAGRRSLLSFALCVLFALILILSYRIRCDGDINIYNNNQYNINQYNINQYNINQVVEQTVIEATRQMEEAQNTGRIPDIPED